MNLNRRGFLKTAGWMGAGLVAAAAQGAVPESAVSRRPNMLFFFPDQHRFDWTGAQAAVGVGTPHLDALAARGVQFERAYCASPLCAPSRACLALGVEYDRCGVPSNKENLASDAETFYRRLRAAGYHVAGCGKFDLNKGEQKWGLDGAYRLSEWGFSSGINNAGKWDALRWGAEQPADPYMKYLHERGLAADHVADLRKRQGDKHHGYTVTEPTSLPEEAYCDNWIGQNGLDLLNQAPSGQPWFLQVNFTGPHAPMDITRRMDAGCRGGVHPEPNQNTAFSPEVHQAIRQNYAAMIENIDRWLGLYMDRLRERGELEHTLIVFSSDHGEMLGDHNLWGKSVPYEPSVGVPLVIAGPGVRSGVRTNALASVMDLTATFLDYGGVAVPEQMDSQSLAPLLRGETDAHRECLYSGLGAFRVVRDRRYKLVQGYPDKGAVALYDLEQDPWERENIAAAHPEIAARLRQRLPQRTSNAG